MKRIGIRATSLVMVIILFLVGMAVFFVDYGRNASTWVAYPYNLNIYSKGVLTRSGTIRSSDGSTLLNISGGVTYYADDATLRRATLHAVGDTGDNIATGILRSYKGQLIGYDLVNGVYNPFDRGNTVTLTIDADVNLAAYNALGSYNGTVGVYNYKTGQILCMVSKPTFDPGNPPDLTSDAYDSVYVNRLFSGLYTPGSVFKVITTAAAIDTIPNLDAMEFTCEGGAMIGDEWVACQGYHGTIDIHEAFAVSCNAAYGVLANELGADVLTQYAEAAGVGEQFQVQGVYSAKGNFDVTKADENDLAWAGIGQYTDVVNPMQFLIYIGAIANGGRSPTPYYVRNVVTSYGLPTYMHIFSAPQKSMMSEETANTLQDMMRNNALTAYTSFAGWELCAKTGTAQLDNAEPHSWFVGFLDDADMPLAFVVVVENGGFGSSTAIPVARAVLEAAASLYQ